MPGIAPHVQVYMRQNPFLHRFTVTKGVIDATSREDALIMCRDMADLGLLRTPYPACWITFNVDDFLDSPAWSSFADAADPMRIHNSATFLVFDQLEMVKENGGDLLSASTDGMTYLYSHEYNDWAKVDLHEFAIHRPTGEVVAAPKGFIETIGSNVASVTMCLVTALATRNVAKQTHHNTRLGTQKLSRVQYQGPAGHNFASNTIIAPPVLSADPQGGTHASPIPHLRRGHKHTFLRGPAHSERFEKWVPPLYVNADPAYVPKAKNYVVVGAIPRG